jgi:DNA-binding response OmpR family regulator
MGSPGVLIIDEDPTTARLAALHSNRMGLSSSILSDIDEALQLFHTRTFAAVLIDMGVPRSPAGMRCLDALVKLRARHAPDTAIIAVTAHASSRDREVCLRAGADAFLGKPYFAREFRQTIDQTLHNRKRKKSA